MVTKDMCGVAWVLNEFGEFPAKFSDNACRIVRDQYFRNGETSFWQVIERVANGILEAPRIKVLSKDTRARIADRLCSGMAGQRFAFNSPVYYNLGINDNPQCSACFIQSVEDDMESIMRLARNEAMLFKHGSGTGTNLSNLRASTEKLSKSDGFASGPVSFMKGYDAFAGVIKSGGRNRRAAKMQLLDDDHPDFLKFVRAKADEDAKAKTLIAKGMPPAGAYDTVAFQNLNSSVRLGDEFMVRAEAGSHVPWVFTERTSALVVPSGHTPTELLREVAQAAWECGDPGVQFYDTIEDHNMMTGIKAINASNPCSEFVFVDESACNLASINLRCYTTPEDVFSWVDFEKDVEMLIRCMDGIVDISGYPTQEIAANSKALRPLGLGLTNVAAHLMDKGLRYGSSAAADYMASITRFMMEVAARESGNIAGYFGEYKGYDFDKHQTILARQCGGHVPLSVDSNGLANAQLTLMAPTGTISFMMDCDSTGIEPVFCENQTKALSGGGTLTIVPGCIKRARARGLDSVVVTAIGDTAATVDDHLSMMAAMQPHLSGAISKTVNLPSTATVDDILKVYVEAWRHGLKCIAVYRDGCKGHQPLTDSSKPLTKQTLDDALNDLNSVPVGVPLLIGGRVRLPDERPSVTHKFTVGGVDGYITVGLYEDGRPGEIFVNMAKEGSTASGFMDAWATMVSIALQYGVPLSVIIDKAKGNRFEPSGFTGNKDIRVATSVLDYVARWMESRFQHSPDGGASIARGHVHTALPDRQRDVVEPEWHGGICPECGQGTVTTGTCKTCPHCGWNGGCG